MPTPTNPRPTPSDTQKALISQLLAQDVELQAVARQFVLLGFKELLNQLQRGDQATKASIARNLAAVITKSITEGGEDEGLATLQAEFRTMAAQMQGAWMEEEQAPGDGN